MLNAQELEEKRRRWLWQCCQYLRSHALRLPAACLHWVSYSLLICIAIAAPPSLSRFALLFAILCFLVCRCSVEQPFCSLRCQFACAQFPFAFRLAPKTWLRLGLALAFQLTACGSGSPVSPSPLSPFSSGMQCGIVARWFYFPFCHFAFPQLYACPPINLNRLRQKKAKKYGYFNAPEVKGGESRRGPGLLNVQHAPPQLVTIKGRPPWLGCKNVNRCHKKNENALWAICGCNDCGMRCSRQR